MPSFSLSLSCAVHTHAAAGPTKTVAEDDR
jgi:hypothetical protein